MFLGGYWLRIKSCSGVFVLVAVKAKRVRAMIEEEQEIRKQVVSCLAYRILTVLFFLR